MTRLLMVVAGLLVVPVTHSVASQQVDTTQQSPTRLLPVSGAVADAAGPHAASGARTITFALFDEADGGTLLWSETQVVNVDARGRYSAYLGAITPLPLDIFRTEQARWLEVSIGGKPMPRTMLVAVPYALRAADAETLGGKPLSDFVLTDGNGRRIRADGTTIDDPAVEGTGVPGQIAKWITDTVLSSSVITESFDSRIGILAPDPTGGGVVDSRFTIRQLDNNTAMGVLNTLNQRRFALNTLSTGGFMFFDGGGGTWNQGLTQVLGRGAIGTNAPDGIIAGLGRLTVHQTAADDSGLFARKTQSDSFRTAIQARSAAGLTGPVVKAIAGVDNSIDFGGTMAVLGLSANNDGIGVQARGVGANGIGIQGTGTLLAGQFIGNVDVTGTLTKGGGAFQIDHPLDPANKYLRHSFVESPDMMNVYNGNVRLDAKGEAWVSLPEWFEALNSDFRYQLTSIGSKADPYIAEEVADSRFKIAGGAPNGKVSWQVTGIRQDAWAKTHRIVVEEDKPAKDRGLYLHPDVFGLPPAMLHRSLTERTTMVVRDRQ